MSRKYFPLSCRPAQWLCTFMLILFGSIIVFNYRFSSEYVTQIGRILRTPFSGVQDTGIFNSNFSSSYTNAKLFIYNRIPKTGGTALVYLVHQLSQANNVVVAFLNISQNRPHLTRSNQLFLVGNLSARTYSERFLLHGHFSYLSFKQHGSTLQPLYINMIRDPLDRLVSYYYFLRFGDDFRPTLVRSRMSDPELRSETFDECIVHKRYDCHPNRLWIQVPYFCGSAAYCRIPGNRAALLTAKRRVVEDYALVGLTEAFDEFVLVLENLFPQIFRGAQALIRNNNGWRMRRTLNKTTVSESTRSFFRSNPIWQAEQEFYEFVQSEFWGIRNALINGPPVDTYTGTEQQPLVLSKQQISLVHIRPTEGG